MKTFNTLIAIAFFAIISVATSFAQTNISTLADADGNLTATITTLDAATDWRLDKKIYVLEGHELHIEAGTIIKATVGSGLAAPAIIVTRSAKIYAIGTEQAPIIMTTVEDTNVDGSYPVINQGKWGGLLILGRAYNNLGTGDEFCVDGYAGEGTIEGLDQPDDRHHYGRDYWEAGDPDLGSNTPGTLKSNGEFNNDDNSGVVKYVSIRHGGALIGDANEINGLTCGSVGRGTVLEHIEVISNADDGIEFFGGNVDIKYATVLFCNDDYIDWDLGYTGRGQFIFGAQLPGTDDYGREGDHGLEIDGDDDDHYNEDPSPEYMSNPTFYNCTFIGNQGSDPAIEAKERTNGEVSNSIFANFAAGVRLATESDRPTDAYENFLAGTLTFRNNTFVGNSAYVVAGGSKTTPRIDPIPASAITQFNNAGNEEDNTLIDFTLNIDADGDNAISDAYNPVPAAGTASTTLAAPADDFFDAAPYRGAFAPGITPWTSNWTYGDILGTDDALNKANCPTDTNDDGRTTSEDLLNVLGGFGTSCLVE